MKTPSILDVSPRNYSKPSVVRVTLSPGVVRYVVCGTDYGFLHTANGDVRTWRSYSGARRVARDYRPF
jgi:hypothetical protein